MKLKVNKKAEIKDIEEAEVVEVGTSAEAKITEASPKEESNVVALDKLTDRELMEETYFAVLDLIKKFDVVPATAHIVTEKKERKQNANKMTPAEKKARKEELLASGPYTKEVLDSWKRRELLMYAYSLQLPKKLAFGVGTQSWLLTS